MIEAFKRLRLRDKILIVLLLLTLTGSLVYGMINHPYWGMGDLDSTWPQSTLISTNVTQTYRHVNYAEFDKMVVFPDTSVSVNVGGNELYPTDIGDAFLYSQDEVVFMEKAEVLQNTQDLIQEHFPYYISGIQNIGTFTRKVYGEGYLNTLQFVYEGGVLEYDNKTMYVLTYRHSTGDIYDILIGFGTTDFDKLTEIKNLLDKMVYTIASVSDNTDEEQASATKVEDSLPESSSETNSISNSASSSSSLKEAWDFESAEEVMDEAQSYQYSLQNDSDEPLTVTVNCPAGISVGAFVLDYSNVSTTPTSAVLVSPSGTNYNAEFLNDDLTGKVIFYVDNPEEGEYTATFEATKAFGKYSFTCLEKDSYTIATKSHYDQIMDGDDTNPRQQ